LFHTSRMRTAPLIPSLRSDKWMVTIAFGLVGAGVGGGVGRTGVGGAGVGGGVGGAGVGGGVGGAGVGGGVGGVGVGLEHVIVTASHFWWSWQGSPKALPVTGTLQLCLPIHNFVTTAVAFAASHELLRLNAALHFTHVGNFPTSAGQSGVP
jgi:hypothetical protein